LFVTLPLQVRAGLYVDGGATSSTLQLSSLEIKPSGTAVSGYFSVAIRSGVSEETAFYEHRLQNSLPVFLVRSHLIQSTTLHPISLKPFLILSSNPRLGFSKWSVSFRFLHQNSMHFASSPYFPILHLLLLPSRTKCLF
jgi:hypothetical protein